MRSNYGQALGSVRFAKIIGYREQLGCDHLLSFSKGCGTSSKTMLCLVHRSGRGRLMPPQGRDSQAGNPLCGAFLWAQLTVPDHAEFALADGHDLGGAAIVDRP